MSPYLCHTKQILMSKFVDLSTEINYSISSTLAWIHKKHLIHVYIYTIVLRLSIIKNMTETKTCKIHKS